MYASNTVVNIVSSIITAFPLAMIGLPWWANMLIIIAVFFIPFVGQYGRIALWILGLIFAILGKQDIFATIYYVCFPIFIVFFAIPFILAMIYATNNRKNNEAMKNNAYYYNDTDDTYSDSYDDE